MENGTGTTPAREPGTYAGEPGRRALVIGAGIGGLTAAAGLAARGWHVTVLERSPTLEPVGAAISLAPNGQRALDRVGVGDAVRDLAAWQGSGGLRAPDGRWLARTSSEEAGERYGDNLVLLHRSTLIDLLRARLPEDAVRVDAAAEVTDPGAADDPRRPARVRTATGELTADLVVAADGIGSATRRLLFPDHPGPEYAGFTTWRIMVPAPAEPFAPHETWAAAPCGAATRSTTAPSTPTRPPPSPKAATPRTNAPSCSAASATGTTPCPPCSRRPHRRASCATTSATCAGRSPPTTAAGSPSSGTPPTP